MTERKIYATEQVLVMNRDICDLYEAMGVARHEVREICRLAAIALAAREKTSLTFYKENRPKKERRP
jgi:hypothetical protein